MVCLCRVQGGGLLVQVACNGVKTDDPQAPVLVSQVPAPWHWSEAVHVMVEVGDPQTPLWQVSPVVQAFPSLQRLPLPAAGFEQTPVLVSHVPVRWH
jgi:hypothetical protein